MWEWDLDKDGNEETRDSALDGLGGEVETGTKGA